MNSDQGSNKPLSEALLVLLTIGNSYPSRKESAYELLHTAGYNVTPASTIMEAQKELEKETASAFIIEVLDEDPHMVEKLFELFRKKPTIVFVTSLKEHLAIKLLSMGAVDYVIQDRDNPHFMNRLVSFATQQWHLNKKLELARTITLEYASLKQRFINRLGKEFTNPVADIVSAVDLILEENPSKVVAEGLLVIRESAKSLEYLAKDILSFSDDSETKASKEIEEFEIREQFYRLMKLLSVEAHTKGISFIYDFQSPHQTSSSVSGDLSTLEQILVLIISGLTRHLPSTSVIRIAGKCLPMNEMTKVTFAHFAIAFTDPTKSAQNQIAFPMATELAEQMKGRIWVDSSSTAGSVTHIVLPLFLAESKPKSSLPDGDLSEYSLKILVVDDNAINRMILEKWLGKRSHKVDTAVNGIEAVRLCSSNHYDLILMDIQMPEMDGYEATKLIREQESGKRTRIYAVSAHLFKSDISECLKAGMDGALMKPVNFQEISSLISNTIAYVLSPETLSPDNSLTD